MMTEQLILTTNQGRSKRRIAGALLLALIGAETYLLISDFSIARLIWKSRESGPRIAEIARSKKSVRVQHSDALTWDDASTGQPLHEGETVMTLSGAQADIAFLSGLGVTLGEDTLITLETVAPAGGKGKPSFRLKLHRGAVRTEKAPDELSIQVGSVDLRPSAGAQLNVVREAESAPAFRVQVAGGQVAATQGERTQNVHEGEVGTLVGQRVAVSRSPFTPIQPADRSVLGGGSEGEPVTFQWKVAASVAGRPQIIEVAATPDFASILRDQTIGATEPPMASVRSRFPGILSLEAGRYYWRIRTASGEKVVGPAFEFTVARPRAPKPYFPTEGDPFEGETEFIWEAIPQTEGYELKVGNQRAIATQEARYKARLENGGAWQVRAKVDGEWSAWSSARALGPKAAAETPTATPAAPAKKASAPPPPEEIDAVIERAPSKGKKKGKKR